jgi:regulator of cell morphogenesis and NO signaling
MMMQEHESAASALREIRKWAADYHLPADACTRWKLLYQDFQELEQDLHQHIHLENNILFLRRRIQRRDPLHDQRRVQRKRPLPSGVR